MALLISGEYVVSWFSIGLNHQRKRGDWTIVKNGWIYGKFEFFPDFWIEKYIKPFLIG